MPIEPLLLTLPYGPSVNDYIKTHNDKLYMTRKGKDYRRLVQGALRRAGVRPFTGDVQVRVDMYRPRRQGDLDNRFKPLFDSLNTIAFDDDDQITRIVAERRDDKHNPRVELEIKPIDTEENLFPPSAEQNAYRKATAAISSARKLIDSGHLNSAKSFIDEALVALAYFPGVLKMGGFVGVMEATAAVASPEPLKEILKPARAPGRPSAGVK